LDVYTQVEFLQVTRYRPGEYFHRHNDYFVSAGMKCVNQWKSWAKKVAPKAKEQGLLDPFHPDAVHGVIDQMLLENDTYQEDAYFLNEKVRKREKKEYNQQDLMNLINKGPSIADRAQKYWYKKFGWKEYRIPRTQRLATLLIYLNEDFTGGETAFSETSEKVNPGASGREAAEEACGAESPALKVTASAGDAILFYNAREDMYPDAMSMHAGCEVKHGSKYVITAWVWTNNHYMNEFGKDMQWIPTHDG